VNQRNAKVLCGRSCVHRTINTTYAANTKQHAVARRE
jgi:hypothetical protein